MPAYHHGNLRATLLEAAERSLREHGAEQLSLRELAREAGVSHAAPRRHFADRQALLDALAETGFARLDTELRAALATAGADFPVRLHAASAAYLRFATEDTALLDVMYAGKHRADRVAEAAAAPFGLLNDVIKDGQKHGAIAPGDPHRPGVLLLATLQGIAALTNGRLVIPELLDGILEAAIEQFLAGQRTSRQ
ncbi:TetR/AcrR family transcriptional regulator [Actinoplanes awajinensis]|uniref:TetR family transcriptional regulator n=1 Tax=Actinoplanes awajinensis subsp. mycoplanecinus TaxID=135947 RepID=A0A117MKV0_9ACTN|nr:TetR/AcrR family transcriptional regulator [Actinoplanes awajinensis]KUL22721.1 TetR family transcriptional regulator [Actinoplanes awajinensis subsp. mycoplanecinus]